MPSLTANRMWGICWLNALIVLMINGNAAADDGIRFFENEVRPIFVEHCQSCHGAKKQSGGLRLDSRESLLKGGDSGAAIVPGKSAASLILKAVRRSGDFEMPPDETLSDRKIRTLAEWVDLGAPWPKSDKPQKDPTADAKAHWAFQPVVEPAVPVVKNSQWVRTPIDAFIMRKLDAEGLTPSPEADRRTLVRRVYYTLTGLPPTAAEAAAFVDNSDPEAYALLIESLLNSPHYGEQWARHWLDVARYSDTKGYVYAREERFWVHAWAYRDWVVQSLNKDMPYNRFLLLQLAADQVADCSKSDLAGMGFLTLGRRFLGVKHDIIDDRIDVVCRGTMGLTVGCARCHDHKYDPIPTADYYSLYGVFDSCAEQKVRLSDSPSNDAAYEQELQKREETLRTKMAAHRAEWATRIRERVADYLQAQTELHKYPAEGFDQIFAKTDMLPAFVRQWEAYLHKAKLRQDPVFVYWHAYREIAPESFATQAAEITQNLQKQPGNSVNQIVAAAFTSPPESFAEVVTRYGAVFNDINQRWKLEQESAEKAGTAKPVGLSDPTAEQLRQVLYGPGAPCEVPDLPIVHSETFFDSAACTELWKLQGEVDRWIIKGNIADPYALTLVDRPEPVQPRIFRRGNSARKGKEIDRHFLSLFLQGDPPAFQQGSGRRELAEAIIDPSNPLTARVLVNRVWTYHFGMGLVPTPSDFGVRAGQPSHPELLDWLASRFMAEGWSLKQLHRSILLSSTFRQSSTGPKDSEMLSRAVQIDPSNRWLWRMNQRRLTFEEFRDSLLAASQELDRTIGGKPTELFRKPNSARRTLYGLVDRQFLPGALRMFDFANPDLHIPKRSETTVPQQALFFMNHPLVLDRARALATMTKAAATPKQRATAMFQQTYQRAPTNAELDDALSLVDAAEQTKTPETPATIADWSYGFGSYDESAQRVSQFTALPHFTGTAWQGGPQWPDAKLGWVQLTATGGHPGNNREHACVRRWTAPRPMTIAVQSKLVHEPAAGDGIRAFVVSSRAGLLQSTTIHQNTMDLHVETLAVAAGETVDFVVDIGKVLNSDQYLWDVRITEMGQAGSQTEWSSQADFTQDVENRLSPWEQLAHVLYCTNEFLFVD